MESQSPKKKLCFWARLQHCARALCGSAAPRGWALRGAASGGGGCDSNPPLPPRFWCSRRPRGSNPPLPPPTWAHGHGGVCAADTEPAYLDFMGATAVAQQCWGVRACVTRRPCGAALLTEPGAPALRGGTTHGASYALKTFFPRACVSGCVCVSQGGRARRGPAGRRYP
jgi:hypothetical protein